MEMQVIKAEESDNVEYIDSLFKEYKVNHIPIVSKKDVLVGIVSKQDYLSYLRYISLETSGKTWTSKESVFFKAHHIMTKNPICLDIADTVKDAINIFIDNKIHCIPVVELHKLVGIITPHDILKCI